MRHGVMAALCWIVLACADARAASLPPWAPPVTVGNLAVIGTHPALQLDRTAVSAAQARFAVKAQEGGGGA